jgi:CRP/FNR family cyclic AMP-dependent transcriptional regulator
MVDNMAENLWRFTGAEAADFASGTVLIPEGERLGKLFVLISGEVEVLRGGTVIAKIDEPGSMLGEMSVLLDMPHSATVRALTPTRTHIIGDATEFLSSRPLLALDLARLVARRLEATTALLAQMRQEFEGKSERKQELGFIEKILASLTQPQPRPKDASRTPHHE